MVLDFSVLDNLELLEPLIESPYIAIVIVNISGNIVVMNQTFLDLLGMNREQVIGKYVSDVIPNSKLPEVLITGRTDRADIWAIGKRDMIVTRFPVFKNGRIIGAIGQSLPLDMSCASVLVNRLEEAEKEFNAFLGAFVESPHMTLVIVNDKGYITVMNQTFLDILGLKKEDVIGKHILEILPHSELPAVIANKRIDKAEIWPLKGRDTLVTRMPIVKDGKVIGALGQSIYLDMSGAYALKQKLQEREKEFAAISAALIESPYMVYVTVDKDGFITAMNQTYLDILGLSKDAVIGKYILDIIPNSRLPEVLRTGEIIEADIWPLNGRESVVTRLPIVKDGQIIGAIGKSLFLDISGVKAFMKKLQETEKELNLYKEEVRQGYQARWFFEDIIGEDHVFQQAKSVAYQLSRTTSTILITGESGTGKELFAHAIHNASSRYLGPFVRINCAALPEHLLESELFGYEDGAFTGAKRGGKPGKFELANGGTIFLDEIGDMPLNMQTKLLSVLQERMVERVGGTKNIVVSVRVIAATNRNLEEMVKKHEFRQDLYYRLNVVRLDVPPLRQRASDIPLLTKKLIQKINKNLGTNILTISPKAMELLLSHSWPGNVRELENILERAINLASMDHENSLTLKHFPSIMEQTSFNKVETLPDAVENLEKQIIVDVLKKTGGNKTLAAKLLGIHSSALYRKLNKYALVSDPS
ncbi:MAG: sigma 54-interacting transcriptional regulator [Syntrophomonadaceae bacterium]